jgi:hypothetical protein
MNKKTIIWIGSGLVVAGLGYLAFNYFKTKKDAKDAEAEAEKANIPQPEAKPVKTVTPVVSSNFPLKKGVRNAKVEELQLALGIPSSTFGFGYFGNQTLSKLVDYYGKQSIANEAELKVAKVKIAKSRFVLETASKAGIVPSDNTRLTLGTNVGAGQQYGVLKGSVAGREVSMQF